MLNSSITISVFIHFYYLPSVERVPAEGRSDCPYDILPFWGGGQDSIVGIIHKYPFGLHRILRLTAFGCPPPQVSIVGDIPSILHTLPENPVPLSVPLVLKSHIFLSVFIYLCYYIVLAG